MKILKTKTFFSYLVVGALVIALSISCKSNEEPPTDFTHSDHPPAGNYVDYGVGRSKATVVNNADGTCHITGTAEYHVQGSQYKTHNFDITITKWYGSTTSYSYAGSSFEQSEATINSPSGVDFSVRYELDSGTGWLLIWFGPIEDITYNTYSLKQQ